MQFLAGRVALAAARQSLPRATFSARQTVVKRTFTAAAVRYNAEPKGTLKKLNEIQTEEDLLPPGAQVGTIPTDYEQATGLERLELLGKLEGVDIFDLKPLDASRRGTIEDPIVVRSAGDEQYVGCTGSPVDSHLVKWLVISRERDIERCPECGSVYKMDYTGKTDDHHHDDHHGDHHEYHEPKTMADFIKPEYLYR